MQVARLKARIPQIAEYPIEVSALYLLARPPRIRPAGHPAYDPDACRFEIEADLGGSFKLFTAATMPPREVAEAVHPITFERRRRQTHARKDVEALQAERKAVVLKAKAAGAGHHRDRLPLHGAAPRRPHHDWHPEGVGPAGFGHRG